jgi:hypothetical protein
MEQIGLSDRERHLLAGTLDEVRSRLAEQMAYSIGATDELDGYGDSRIMREVEASEECQRLTARLDLPLQTWQTILAPDPDIPHAALAAAIEVAMQALGYALDLAADPVPVPEDLARRLETVFEDLGWIHNDLTTGDDDDDGQS